jgi:hypothetical protein
MNIKRGNKVVLVFSAIDTDTNLPIDNLAAATAIKFQIKTNKADTTPLISKDLTDGVQRNTPLTGDITVTINANDYPSTETNWGEKYIALQIEYSATDIKEIELKYKNIIFDQINIEQDIIK